jgi:ATP phosphoribosyltransferase regulatory subunit
MREFLQAGIELVGAPGPDGTVEALTVLCEAMDAVGLVGYRIALGSAALYPALLATHRVDPAVGETLLAALAARDFVRLEHEVADAGLHEDLLRVPQLRGGPEVLDQAGPAADGLREVHELLPPADRERVIFDLGLLRELGYYTGAIFEVFDTALGVPLGGGGRYDELLGRFGRPMPAVGWALEVERVHAALNAERSG